MQIGDQLSDGTTSVRDGILLIATHLGKGAVVALGDKQRVVTKTLRAARVVDDVPLDNPLEETLLAPLNEADGRAEAGSAVGLPLQIFQKKAVVGRKVVAIGALPSLRAAPSRRHISIFRYGSH